jgi:general secretion pathway protein M
MNFFWNLQRRERLFVVGAGLTVVGILLFMLLIDPVLKSRVLLKRQITTATRQLEELQTLQKDYVRQKNVVEQINLQLRQQQKNFAIFSRLEELAGQTGIREKILYMKPTVSPPNEVYNEESVEIKMEGVTLAQLIRYLNQVENSPQLLKVKRLYIKPRLDNRQILSVIFRVSIFSLKEASS